MLFLNDHSVLDWNPSYYSRLSAKDGDYSPRVQVQLTKACYLREYLLVIKVIVWIGKNRGYM